MNIQQVPVYDITPDFSRAQYYERGNILIVSLLQESIECESTIEFIKTLNSMYNQVTGDVAPYHYYVDIDGTIYSSKQDILKVNPTSELKSFSEDIIIMVMNRDITLMPSAQKEALMELVSVISNNYVMGVDKIIFYPESYVSSGDAAIIANQMLHDITNRKSDIEKLYFICENSDSSIPTVSQFIGIIKSDENCCTFRDFSLRFNISEDILRPMNPHIISEIQPGQIVFYPKTTITKSINGIELFKKDAEKYYKLCQIQVEE